MMSILLSSDGLFINTNKPTMLHYLLSDHSDEEQHPKDDFFGRDSDSLIHSPRKLATDVWSPQE